MHLPRSLIAKNANLHSKKKLYSDNKKFTNTFNSICKKHGIYNLTFRSCKFADENGKITLVEHDSIIGNMRSSILVIKAKSLTDSDTIYDIVEIERKVRERKNKLEEQKKEEIKNTIPETLENKEEKNSDLNEIYKEFFSRKIEELKKENPNLKMNQYQKLINEDWRRFRREHEKEETFTRNKYHRNFMADLKSKFDLGKRLNFKYLELRMETADAVIVDTEVYEIKFSGQTERYFIIIGDLQMKRELINQIDPSYGSEKVIEEQIDLVERLKTNEIEKK
jgi:hypothetical protein